MAVYGGRQQGLPQLTLDPLTGENVITYGDVEVSPQSQHQYSPMGSLARGSAQYVGLPILVAGTADYLSGLGNGAAATGSGAVTTGMGGGAAGAGAGAATGAGAAAGSGAGAGTTAAGVAGAGGFAKWLPMINNVARGIGAYTNQRAANRQAEQENEYNYDIADQRRYQLELQREQMDLQRRQYLQDLYDRNTDRAIRGGALQGVQDLNIQAPAGIPMGTVTGGLRPSAIQGREQIGGELQRQALMGMMEGRGSQPTLTPQAQAFISQWQATNPATTESLRNMIAAAKAQGIDLGQPTHAGGTQVSNDKILQGSGVFDLIRSEGGPDAAWQMSPDGYFVDGRPASDPMGGRLPELPRAPVINRRTSRPSRTETGLGMAQAGLSWLPDILSMVNRRPQAPMQLSGNQYGWGS